VAGLGWEVLELVLEVDSLVVDLACVCGGGAFAGGGAGVVAGVADVVAVLATAPVAAAATAREVLGGKEGAVVVLWAGGAAMAHWARGLQ